MEWVRGPVVGRGSFATVSIAFMSKEGKVVAVKSAPLCQSESLRREEELLRVVAGCPHVVACHGHDVTRENGAELYNLFLEYAPGGSLADVVSARGSLPEGEVRRHARSVLMGLRHVHGMGYVHCDVKLQNVLVGGDGCDAKIADFGLAKRSSGNGVCDGGGPAYFLRGTPLYMAPESVSRGVYDSPSDIWSLGCAVVELATGKPAWSCAPDCGAGALLLRIGCGNESPLVPEGMSEEGKDFLRRCFVKDPSQRWTAEMLLNHPFIAADVAVDCSGSITEYSPRAVFEFPRLASPKSASSSICASPSSPECLEGPVARIEQLASGRWEGSGWDSSAEGWITVREAESPASGTERSKGQNGEASENSLLTLEAMISREECRMGECTEQDLFAETMPTSDSKGPVHLKLPSFFEDRGRPPPSPSLGGIESVRMDGGGASGLRSCSSCSDVSCCQQCSDSSHFDQFNHRYPFCYVLFIRMSSCDSYIQILFSKFS